MGMPRDVRLLRAHYHSGAMRLPRRGRELSRTNRVKHAARRRGHGVLQQLLLRVVPLGTVCHLSRAARDG